MSLTGPLGLPTHIENYGTVVCVAGGFCRGSRYAHCPCFEQAGNKVISILGARSKELIFWEEELRASVTN